MTDQLAAVVVGAGQAGLAVSHELRQWAVDHVVLERRRVAEAWRGRWDSFCLVTPNWTVQLPGGTYDGDDPDGFMPRDDVVAHLERYAAEAPVREGVEVTRLRADGRAWRLDTSAGDLAARAVVICTGAYQRPHRPPGAATLPANITALDVEDYRAPADLPAGAVLIVGSGQSGCQIAEELHAAGRDVFLACGRAPWVERRFGGHDLLWWTLETGFMDTPPGALPSPAARLAANVLVTGHDGGRDMNLRTLQAQGIHLLGHFLGAEGRTARFAGDLHESVTWGDHARGQVLGLCHKVVAERGLPPLELPEPEPFDARPREELDLRGVGAVLFAGGFRPDYERWIDAAGAFDAMGFPVHQDGASTAADGLHFAGVHFLRKRKSSLLVGVGEDAGIVAEQVARAA
jgi:putative flavoprotein involved in K+ transport